MITCSRGCTWTGLNRCHCSVCHETFGGLTGFDRHRRNGECLDPLSINLHQNADGYWVQTYLPTSATRVLDSSAISGNEASS